MRLTYSYLLKRVLALALVSVIFPLFVNAAEYLKWSDVKEEVLENNFSIVRERKSLQAAELEHRKSYSSFYPDFSAGASYVDSYPSRDDNFNYSISGDIDFFPGLRITDEIKLSETQLEIQKIRYQKEVADSVAASRSAFAELLTAQENITLLKHILSRREENLELVELRYEAGRENKGAYLRSRADVMQAEHDIERARRDIEVKKRNLLTLMGRGDYRDITAKGSLDFPDYVELRLDEVALKNPDYALAYYQLRAAEYRLSMQRKSLYPDINLSAGVSWSGSTWPPDDSRRIGVTLSYPFFSGGRNIIDRKTSDINREISLLRLEETGQNVFSSLLGAYNRFKNSVENIKVREKYMEALEVRVDVAAQQYRNGLISFNEWDSVENEYITARNRIQEAEHSAFIAWSEFIRAAGKTESFLE